MSIRDEPGHLRLASGLEGWNADQVLTQRWSAIQRALGHFAYRAFPRISNLALALDASRLHFSGIPKIFSRNLHQIDPSLNDDLLDLYGRTEQVLANQFSFLNLYEKFEDEIDWQRHENRPWCAELHAFDYAVDLALTYRISREARYGHPLRYLIANWIAANLPVEGPGWQSSPLARRISNWILASDLARDDWEQNREFLQVVSQSLAFQSTYLARQAGSPHFSNDALQHVRALLLAGRCFAGSTGEELRSKALAVLREQLELRLGCEPRPNSQLLLATTVLEWLIFDARSDEANKLVPQLREILQSLQGILLPDGTLPLFGPSARASAEDLSDLSALATVWLEEPMYKSLAGKFGIRPYMLLGEEGKSRFERLPDKPWKATDQQMPQGGLYRLCGTDSSGLVINARVPISPRDHQDFGSYELCLEGFRVVVDSGAYAPEGELGNEYFRSAWAHNVLLVDGQGPNLRGPARRCPTPEGWELGPNFTGLRLPNCGFAFLGLTHERAWFRLGEGFWVVIDRLEGRSVHRSVSLIHFYPTFEIQLTNDRAVARSYALAVTVIPLGRPAPNLVISRDDSGAFPGWFAPDFGVKQPANVLALEWPLLELPWLGGYIIVPETRANFHERGMDSNRRTICFELSGEQYRLSLAPLQEGGSAAAAGETLAPKERKPTPLALDLLASERLRCGR